MNVVIYCSSKENISQEYKTTAASIGQWIGSHNATLVYGGIDLGLMKIAATETRNAGGRAIGIVPIDRKAMEYPHNDESIYVADLSERKARLIELGDVFIVLPGGYGSLDEWMSTLATLAFTNDTRKTIIVVNQNGLFDNTITQLHTMIDDNLMHPYCMQRMKIVASANECCEILQSLIS